MRLRPLPLALAVAAFCSIGRAADEPAPAPAPAPTMSDLLRAKIAAEAKKQNAKPAPPAPAAPAASAPDKFSPLADSATPAPAATPAKDAPKSDPAAVAKAAQEKPTVLPKVEVKKDKITVLDHQLAEQQKEIDREKKNTQPTELDKALNNEKVSKALTIFGGNSNENRANIASERVSLMEAEGDLLEAIAHAKTKEEKAELQKQLDELRAYRRELEKSLR
ncbi:MAG TPA: hypothetical protein VHD62_18000 [Opitutaceae bacterium]|nr:hypothetical protein [Opitutaceae bacterium]